MVGVTDMQSEVADIVTVDSRLVYENRWMRVREDTIRRRDGSPGIYGVVEKPHFAVIVPLDTGDRVHLVQQYRYPVRARYWEFPQGAWEQVQGVDPLELARGELREETGLDAAEMLDAGHLFQGYGYCTQGYNVFLARSLRRGEASLEPEEQDLISRDFPLATLERMIRDGEIQDATSVAAFGLLRLKGLI
jgi:ADP-ribose pyrophosphatase